MNLSHPSRFCARRLLLAVRWLAFLLWLLAAFDGCASRASRDKGFDDEFAGQAAQMRSSKTGGQKLGLSARSQQIESDLGVQ
ncbi:MAG TPA: hypothetical protein VIK18_16775 [Pirellulales bacterium]